MSWQIPVKTPFMKKQSEHLPSMEYAKDIYRVATAYRNNLLEPRFLALEIGAAWGFSTLAILEAGAKHLTSVDPNVLAEGHNEAIANGYTNHALTCQRSEDFWKENATNYDLIYVDGSHLYKDVKNDLYEAWKRINPGGILMIDDWDHPKNIKAEGDTSEYGVSLACFEFWKAHFGEVAMVDICGRVLWFKKREVD